jgi:hypothetical protein
VSDPFDVLRRHVRQQAAGTEPGTSTDELVAHITLEHHRADGLDEVRVRRPRRWAVVGAVVAAAVGVGAGAVVTASLERPQVTQLGVACHPSVAERGTSLVVALGDDPIEDCAAVWRAGDLPNLDEKSPPSDPPLVACASDRGVIEVFPGSGPEVCTDAGLVPADIDAIMSDPLLELSRRIVDEINLTCPSFDGAIEHARQLLEELGFAGWNLVAVDDGGECGVVGNPDPQTRTLSVRTVPASD